MTPLSSYITALPQSSISIPTPIMPGFLSTFADKAQSAINSTPLAGHLPNVGHAGRPPSADPAAQPSTTEATSSSKSHALGHLSHQFRSMQQQFSYVVGLFFLYQMFFIFYPELQVRCKS
jgi:hypothetical protein